MGRSARRAGARVGTLAFCAVAAVTLSACFAPAPPKPAPQQAVAPPTTAPPTTTTTTTPLPAPAQLSVAPNPLTFTAERTATPAEDAESVTIKNTGGSASGPIDVTTASVLDDPNHADTGMWFFSDVAQHCLNQPLAPGATCTFTLVLEAGVYENRSWTGDLVAQATPGNAVHVPVNAHVTSKLLFDPVTELDATPTLDASTHFVLLNDSAQDLGPMTFSLVDAGMPGGSTGTISHSTDADYGIPPCSDGMTLAAGTSCQWLVTYTNPLGTGGDTAFLTFDVPGVLHAQAGFNGVGVPDPA